MSTDNTNLVILGFPELAAALTATGKFGSVQIPASTAALRDLIKGGALPKEKNRLVFLFSSAATVDTTESMEYLVGRLSAAGWRVIVLATSPHAKDIVNAHPAAGYLEGPFSVNQTLGALSGLGVVGLEPIPGGFDAVYQGGAATSGWVPAPGTSPTPPPRAPEPAPITPPPSNQPIGGAWVRPAESQATPAPTTTTTHTQPNAGWNHSPRPTPQPPASPPQWTPQPSPAPVAPPSTPQPPTSQQQTRHLVRPGSSDDTSRPLARPGTPGPIGRRIGTYQDFAPSGPSARRRGHVITVASPKGGTGKSSLSANLAVHLGLSLRGTGRRVALVDANFQQADTGKLLNVYTPNISNILKDEGSLVPERIEQYLIDRRDLNASFLLGPATPRDATPTFFNARLYSQVLAVLKQNFDYILIDTPVAELYHDILRGFALPLADYIVVPITPAIHTLMNADGWLRTITQPRHQGGDEVDPAKIGVVLNQAQDGVDCDEDEVRRELYAWTFIGSVPMTKEWLRANNNNEFVATKNLPVISEAFANILYAATGEEVLLQGLVAANQGNDRKGMLSKLRRRR